MIQHLSIENLDLKATKSFLKIHFEFIPSYIKNVKRSLKDQKPKEKDSFWQATVKSMGNELNKLQLKYLYHSSYLYIYAEFEDYMSHIGKLAKKHSKSRLSVGDLKGGNSENKKLIDYLEKHLEFNIDKRGNLWREVDLYTELRNQLSHSSTRVTTDSPRGKKLIAYFEKDEKISYNIENSTFVINDIKFLNTLCQKLSEYSLMIIDLLIERYDPQAAKDDEELEWIKDTENSIDDTSFFEYLKTKDS
ncbi:MAG: hypothetical protein ACJAWR_002079 [Flavobacteriales bacterium]|jgi:hypothetical protein